MRTNQVKNQEQVEFWRLVIESYQASGLTVKEFCKQEGFLCRQPTDMRRSFDSLAMMVQCVIKQNPLSGYLFVFRNKPKRKKLPEDLPREILEYDINDSEKVCDCCGEQLPYYFR